MGIQLMTLFIDTETISQELSTLPTLEDQEDVSYDVNLCLLIFQLKKQ